jgi:signal transduction histidine kinase
VHDHGGGWPAGGADRAALFLYTSRPGRARGNADASWQYSRAHGAQLEGLGAGLALADLHARFLGGSLSLGGLPGHGAHAAFSFDVTGDRTDASPLLLW